MDILTFDTAENRCSTLLITGLYLLITIPALMTLYSCGENKNIISASRVTNGQATLSWHDVPKAVAYDLHLSTTPGVTALNAFKIPDVSSPITITDLEPGTTYYFILIATDELGQGNISEEVAFTATSSPGNIHFNGPISPAPPEQKPAAAKTGMVSETVSNTKDTGKQARPKQSSAAVGYGEVTLTWDDVSNAVSYNIYWSNKKGVTKHNGTKISHVKNPHTIAGLKKGSTYYFIVTAVNESGESAASESISFTVDK
jgi:Fibronectin type III domain